MAQSTWQVAQASKKFTKELDVNVALKAPFGVNSSPLTMREATLMRYAFAAGAKWQEKDSKRSTKERSHK